MDDFYADVPDLILEIDNYVEPSHESVDAFQSQFSQPYSHLLSQLHSCSSEQPSPSHTLSPPRSPQPPPQSPIHESPIQFHPVADPNPSQSLSPDLFDSSILFESNHTPLQQPQTPDESPSKTIPRVIFIPRSMQVKFRSTKLREKN